MNSPLLPSSFFSLLRHTMRCPTVARRAGFASHAASRCSEHSTWTRSPIVINHSPDPNNKTHKRPPLKHAGPSNKDDNGDNTNASSSSCSSSSSTEAEEAKQTAPKIQLVPQKQAFFYNFQKVEMDPDPDIYGPTLVEVMGRIRNKMARIKQLKDQREKSATKQIKETRIKEKQIKEEERKNIELDEWDKNTGKAPVAFRYPMPRNRPEVVLPPVFRTVSDRREPPPPPQQSRKAKQLDTKSRKKPPKDASVSASEGGEKNETDSRTSAPHLKHRPPLDWSPGTKGARHLPGFPLSEPE